MVTKDLDSHATVRTLLCLKPPNSQFMLLLIIHNTQNIQQKYAAKGATIGSDLPVEFESDSISLQLPSEEDIRGNGWKIVTPFSPAVRKLQFAFTVLSQLLI